MGKIMEIQTFRGVNINVAGNALAAVPGDSLIVKNAKEGSRIRCIAMWGKLQLAAGYIGVLSPLLHDSTRGFRTRCQVNTPDNQIPYGVSIPLHPQDNLTVQALCVDAAADEEYVSMLNYYDDFPNVAANLIGSEALKSRIKNITTVEDTSGATAINSYSGNRVINVASDLLHANTEYALLGFEVGILCHAITVIAPDFANFRVGCPGNIVDSQLTQNWFKDLAEANGIDCIPVFNTANKGNIIIQVVQDENAVVVPFSLVLAELHQ